MRAVDAAIRALEDWSGKPLAAPTAIDVEARFVAGIEPGAESGTGTSVPQSMLATTTSEERYQRRGAA